MPNNRRQVPRPWHRDFWRVNRQQQNAEETDTQQQQVTTRIDDELVAVRARILEELQRALERERAEREVRRAQEHLTQLLVDEEVSRQSHARWGTIQSAWAVPVTLTEEHGFSWQVTVSEKLPAGFVECTCSLKRLASGRGCNCGALVNRR